MKNTNYKIAIKNMVCPRCIEAVEEILTQLNFQFIKVNLGKVLFEKELNPQENNSFKIALEKRGFEYVVSLEDKIISQIKALIVERIHFKESNQLTLKCSEYLEQKMQIKYSKLSKIFSTKENRTIEKFFILQKIEKVKELLDYGELNLSEISYRLDYSSPQHLSKQFKQITKQTPSQYKKDNNRNFIDEV